MQTLIGMLAGLGLAIFVVYCYFLLQAIKGMRDAAVSLNTTLGPLLKSESMSGTLQAITIGARLLPRLLEGMAGISSAVAAFNKAVLSADAAKTTTSVGESISEEGSFGGAYDETKAAENEMREELKKQGVDIDAVLQETDKKTWVGASV